ncbi:MAG: toxin-antitoxin system HicB family antitoxin [Syntrophorhabdales bacterium]
MNNRAPSRPPSNLKQLVVRVPEEVHRAMKIRAAEKGRSVAVIVEGLIREYLSKENYGA